MYLKEHEFIEKIEKLENRRTELETELKKLKMKEKKIILEKKYKESNEKRRARTHHLISIGGLVKVAGIDEEDKETLLGFFLEFHKLDDNKKENLRVNGIVEFERRKKEKELEKMTKKK